MLFGVLVLTGFRAKVCRRILDLSEVSWMERCDPSDTGGSVLGQGNVGRCWVFCRFLSQTWFPGVTQDGHPEEFSSETPEPCKHVITMSPCGISHASLQSRRELGFSSQKGRSPHLPRFHHLTSHMKWEDLGRFSSPGSLDEAKVSSSQILPDLHHICRS